MPFIYFGSVGLLCCIFQFQPLSGLCSLLNRCIFFLNKCLKTNPNLLKDLKYCKNCGHILQYLDFNLALVAFLPLKYYSMPLKHSSLDSLQIKKKKDNYLPTVISSFLGSTSNLYWKLVSSSSKFS